MNDRWAPDQPSKRLKLQIADSAAADAMGVNPRFIEYFSTPSTEVDPIAWEGAWQSDHTLAQAFTQPEAVLVDGRTDVRTRRRRIKF